MTSALQPRRHNSRLSTRLASVAAGGAMLLGAAAAAPALASDRVVAVQGKPNGDRGDADLAGPGLRVAAKGPVIDPLDLAVGAALFRRLWVSSPASATGSDGLGPLYNARACAQCHPAGRRAPPPFATNAPGGQAELPGLVLRLSIPPTLETERAQIALGRTNVIPEPVNGRQLQTAAIQGHAAEGRLAIRLMRQQFVFPDGEVAELMRPEPGVAAAAYGDLRSDALLSLRLAPQLAGMGLLAAIPEAVIVAAEDPADRDGDGIAGRANWVWSVVDGRPALGRFGWKAGSPSLDQQVAEALAVDMGLSSPLFREAAGDCTSRQPSCLAAPNGADARRGGVEVGAAQLAALVNYTASFRPPPSPPANRQDQAELDAGRALFTATGCAACHRPRLPLTAPTATDRQVSGDASALPDVQPFTDLLVHDMGEGLADGRPEGRASGRDWRTAPLWGIGAALASGPVALLHDGRARNLVEAIVWHDGEARRSRDAFTRLPRATRQRLLRFIASL